MVISKRSLPPVFTAAALAVVLAGALAAASCEFFTSNIMPTYLSRAEGVSDFTDVLAGVGLGASFRIETMRFLKAGGRDFIALYVTSSSGHRLVLLDGKDLSLIRAYDDPELGRTILTDMEGYIVSGRGWSGTALRVSPAGSFAAASFAFGQNFGEGASGFSSGGESFLIWSNNGNDLTHSRYMAAWAPGGLTSQTIDNSGTYFGLGFRDVLYEDGKVRVLLSSDMESSGLVLTFPSILDFMNSFYAPWTHILEYTNLIRAPVPSGDDESGWLVPGAAIVLRHDNETRLTRYDAESGKELDSYILRDSEDTRISFSPDGKKWLLYDGRSGRLHLLRTWW